MTGSCRVLCRVCGLRAFCSQMFSLPMPILEAVITTVFCAMGTENTYVGKRCKWTDKLNEL